jgi:hypothetical protein
MGQLSSSGVGYDSPIRTDFGHNEAQTTLTQRRASGEIRSAI